MSRKSNLICRRSREREEKFGKKTFPTFWLMIWQIFLVNGAKLRRKPNEEAATAYPFYCYCFILMDFSFGALFTFFTLQLLRNHLGDLKESEKEKAISRCKYPKILQDIFSAFKCCWVEFLISREKEKFEEGFFFLLFPPFDDIKLYVLFSSEALSVCLLLLFFCFSIVVVPTCTDIHTRSPHCLSKLPLELLFFCSFFFGK